MSDEIKQQIVDNLMEVYDPEIPINVYDLGLIYEITVKGSEVHILMTLTSPTCPTAEYLQEKIQEAAELVDEVSKVEVELTFEPRWTPERVSKEAKEELGITESPAGRALDQTFTPINEPIKEKTCFNCGATEKEFPVMQCYYKGEMTYICTKCTTKFV